MTLSPGVRLGAYEVLALVGTGGMGEVYRAHDTKLGRDVAIKILPPAFADDPERLARFQREAQVLAALNHPNIAAIYGLEDAEGLRALVLELVEGPTLADRLVQGPIPLDEALPIARQIAEALEAAHEHEIIHRDLKPSNIKLRPDGTVKVLDFGLAKVLEGGGGEGWGEGAPPSQLPTLSVAGTRAGVILGTAAYMSPEQARGKPVDKRADIWAFGCVLYEILAGRRAFAGDDASDTLAAILRAEPDWNALPADTPASLRRLLRRCLEKDRRQRLADIADARLELDDTAARPATDGLGAAPTIRPRLWHRPVPLLVVAISLVAVTAVGMWAVLRSGSVAPRTVTRFSLTLPTGDRLTNVSRHAVAIAADGTRVVYSANNQLYLRPLDQLTPTPIRGTEGGRSPFFSPDGQWVGFWHSGHLKKVAVSGGAAVTLCEALDPFGASWGGADTIFYGQGAEGIWRVPAAGGKPERVISVESGQLAHGPQLLPGDDWVLFTLSSGSAWDEAQTVVHSLETGERKVVVRGGTDARYLPSGHLVYAHQGTLLAVPFDLARAQIRGGPVPVLDSVLQAPVRQTGAAHFSVSREGALVYVPGGATARRRLVWVDRSGREEPIPTEPQPFLWPRISPDRTRLAVELDDPENVDIVVYDLERQTSMRLTFDPGPDRGPVWSPDGRSLAFASDREGGGGLFRKASDGTGQEERLSPSAPGAAVSSWSPDGKTLIFSQGNPKTGGDQDLWALALEAERTARPFLVRPGTQAGSAISPDGRWLAYASTESGELQVYVHPFPDVESGRWLITPRSGYSPVWSADGRALFYRTGRALMVVPVDTSGRAFRWRNPQLVFERSYFDQPRRFYPGRHYDVSPDGQRFVMIKEEGEDPLASQRMIVVLNWFEELKRRVPTPK